MPTPRPGVLRQPDWGSLIEGDPDYMSTAAQIRASQGQAGRARRSAIQRALIAAGFTPQGFQSGYGDIDEATLAAARGNPASTLANLNTQRSRSRADLAAVLGARGMLSSGALTGGEQRIQSGYEGAYSDAQRQLLDSLLGYEGAYAGAEEDLRLQDLAARQAAASRLQESYVPTYEPQPGDITGPNEPEFIQGPGNIPVIQQVAGPPRFRPRAGYTIQRY